MTENNRVERSRQKAHEYDKKYSGCSQSVLGALQEEFGIGDRASFMAATALSGGVARLGETCGAVTGMLMALGIARGREKIEDSGAMKALMNDAGEACRLFREEVARDFKLRDVPGSCLCRELQQAIYGKSFDLTTAAGFDAFIAAGGHADWGCPKVCGAAAKVAAEKLSQMLDK